MSDFDNPYKSPETSIVPEKTQVSGGVLTDTMLGYLKQASPWLRFVGIFGFISTGFLCVSGIISAFSVTVLFSDIMETAGFINFPFWIMPIVYLGIATIVFFPALFTYNFGTKIRNYQFSGSNEDLELAFSNNKSLWKFNGILLIINIAFVPFMIIIGIIVGITAAFNAVQI